MARTLNGRIPQGHDIVYEEVCLLSELTGTQRFQMDGILFGIF